MGLVYAEITLKNSVDVVKAAEGTIATEEIRQITVQSMVDTGAWTLVINEATREKLGLRFTRTHRGKLADGTRIDYQFAGPVDIDWKNRGTTCEAIVLPEADEILLGAIPLEAMDLMIHPNAGELVGVHGDEVLHRI